MQLEGEAGSAREKNKGRGGPKSKEEMRLPCIIRNRTDLNVKGKLRTLRHTSHGGKDCHHHHFGCDIPAWCEFQSIIT